MTDRVNLSRRGLFRGRLSAPKAGIQLPWSVSWDEFVAGCTAAATVWRPVRSRS
jgi:ferredoxin-type protein NapF